jgi:hypothetical protein
MVSELMPKTLREYVSPGSDPLASVTPGGYYPHLDRMRLVSSKLGLPYLSMLMTPRSRNSPRQLHISTPARSFTETSKM